MSGTALGERVRSLRRGRALTLDGLAERSGVSRAMLSKVERGETNPTLVTAARLAEGLGVTLSELAGLPERRRVVLTRADQRTVLRDPETGFERQLLAPTLGARGVEFVRNVIPPGGDSGTFPPHRRGVDEYILVESGTLAAAIGGERYVLGEGDALYFEADVPHSFENAGEGVCSYYLIIASGE